MAEDVAEYSPINDDTWQDIADILEKDSDMDQESTTPTNEDKETCLNPQCSEDGVANKHMLAHTTDNDISVQNDIRVTQSKSPLKRKQNNNSTEEPEPYSSDDELPLKTIQLKIRKEMCEMDADYYSDDSVKDPTFSIKEELKKMRKIKQNYKVREKGWKRKPTALNNKKKACPGRPKFKDQEKTKDSEFRRALSQSKKVFMAKQVILKYHIKTLDALLASNSLQKKSVDGDGNCFFSAIHNATQIYGDQNELRKGICDYIQSNKEDFTPFLTSQEQDFECQIQKLRENGIWAVELADALPLATANKLQREIVIYSSSRDLPVTRIKPTTIENAEHATIALSYLKVPGFEHYDGVEELKTPQTPKKKRKEKTIEKNTTPKKCVSSTPNVTPRKQAIYVSPKQKCLSRKRQRQPEKWKRNIRKKLRLAGKEYTSTAGKTVQAKGVQDIDCAKCRYKCKSKISQEDRNNIFNAYWSLENYQRQKDFICKNVTEHKPTRILTTAKKPRGRSRVYTFQIEGSRLQVCKTFFVKTLDISQKSIDSALKAQNVGTYVKSDGRGRHRPHNATPQALLDDVRKHIESFPVVSAHYTRKDTARKFLGCDLNIKKMYNLYVDECKAKGKKCVGHTVYRKTFCEEYNFSFHVPKKDQCPICTVYQQAEETGEITEALRAEYEDHQKRKIMARNEKDLDKKFCKEKDSYHVATFDLEAVLPVPCSLISQVYYKRKLACYNLSVYSLADGKATCYLWNESEGKRGSCEIATCLLLYLKYATCVFLLRLMYRTK